MTREENLKKINDELEKLDDEQLEKIAGGYTWNHWDCIDKPNTANDQNSPANQLDVVKLAGL